MLPSTDSSGADVTAERLRATAGAVELPDIGLPNGIPLCVGAATGVHTSSHDLVREADLALYRAKAEARDTREEDLPASRGAHAPGPDAAWTRS
jgi:GGDEF domain-containing protein